ncbi:MAG: SGNH/GDSL hydrolase family protein [Pseudohongiellaceae bacterium]
MTQVSYHAVLLVLLAVFARQSIAQPPQDDDRWVTTWSASPSSIPNDDNASEVDNQTLRMIVHTSLGGEALRLRLSNTHGDQPLRIGSVTVALHDEGSRVQEDTSRKVTFSQNESISIARGAVVLSDPLPFDVPRTGNLAVSIYLPEASGPLTSHLVATQTNYASSSGNHTEAASLPVATEFSTWHLLTAVDVVGSERASAIVTLGDSITDGTGSTVGANQRWPNHFARRLYAEPSVTDYAVVNAGISGNRVTTEESPRFGQNLQARFERDVLALSNVSHIVLLEGINDIGMSSRSGELVTAEAVIAGYRQIIARAHADGIRVIGATLLPYEGAAYFTEAGERVREQVNEFILQSGEFDGVIEFGPAVADPSDPDRIRASFTSDNLHPNDEGYAAMAEAVDLSLFE